MDNYRAILAIVLAFFVLLAYQFLFVSPEKEQQQATVEKTVKAPEPEQEAQGNEPVPAPAAIEPVQNKTDFEKPASLPSRKGRDIIVETNKYRAVISETGGGIKSFRLKNYRETVDPDSELKELILTDTPTELPLYSSWGVEPKRAEVPIFTADQEAIKAEEGGKQTLTMTAKLSSGLQITRRFTFSPDSYLVDLSDDIYKAIKVTKKIK